MRSEIRIKRIDMTGKPIPLTIDAATSIIHAYFERNGVPRYDPIRLQQYIVRKVWLSKPLYDKRKDHKTILDATVIQWSREFVNDVLETRRSA